MKQIAVRLQHEMIEQLDEYALAISKITGLEVDRSNAIRILIDGGLSIVATGEERPLVSKAIAESIHAMKHREARERENRAYEKAKGRSAKA